MSVPCYGIHGTKAPQSFSRFQSHGCSRLRAEDIADLFTRVEIGTPGISVYEPVVLALIDGALWLEAHPDVYRRGPRHPLEDVIARAARIAPDVTVDTAIVTALLRTRDGRPYRIDAVPSAAPAPPFARPSPRLQLVRWPAY